MANLSDKDRETLREQAQILRTAPGSDSDGFAGQVLASWLTTQPVMPKRLTYRIIWNGVDSFDIVRAA